MHLKVKCPERPCQKEFVIDTETEFLTAQLESGHRSVYYQRQCPHCKEWVTVERPGSRRKEKTDGNGRSGTKRPKKGSAAKSTRKATSNGRSASKPPKKRPAAKPTRAASGSRAKSRRK